MSKYDFSGLEDEVKPIAPQSANGFNFSGVDEIQAQDEHSSFPQAVVAGVEGAARGLTLGASDFLAKKISSPEAVRAREVANPVASTLGNVAGGAALIYGTGGLAAPAEGAMLAKGVAPIAARALAYGAEGAAFGAANTVSDLALGDTDITAGKVLADLGIGAALGSGLGLLSKGLEAAPLLSKDVPLEPVDIPNTSAQHEFNIAESAPPTPKSLKEMKAFNESAPFMGQDFEAPPPKVQAVEEAAERLPDLQAKPTGLHKDNLLGKTEQDRNNSLLKSSPDLEDTFNKYSAHMRKEINAKTDSTIESIAPDHTPSSDAVANGENFGEVVQKQYQAEKDELVPVLKQLKEYETKDPLHKQRVISFITNPENGGMPELSRMFDTSSDEIKISPYKTAYGFDKSTYEAVKQMVDSLDEPAFVKELMSIRKGLDQNINIMEQGQGAGEIRHLKALMMDYIQGEVEKVDPLIKAAAKEGNEGASIRDVFKRYAINEQNRGLIEKTFGVSIDNGGFKKLVGKPASAVLNKIFSNEETVKAVKTLLPKEEFEKLLANYVSQLKEAATKDGVLSSAKFGTILNDKKGYVLNEAFSDKPQVLQRLKDLNTISRLVPDLPSGNPSGTANTVFELFKKLSSPAGIAGMVKDKAIELLHTRAATEELNAKLAGQAQQVKKISTIQKIIDKTNNKINTASKDIFNGTRGAVESGISDVTSKQYSERIDRIKELANDPSALMEHFDKSTVALQQAAPNVTQSLNNSIVNGIQFLNSKIPMPSQHFVLSQPPKPSPAQIYQFNKYFTIVNDPIHSLAQVKNGSLTNETMETLQAVHPKLLGEMQKSILSNWSQEEAENLPYAVKLSLSKFLGQPLDENMTPQAIIAYQVSFATQEKGPDQANVTQGGLNQLDPAKLVATRTNRLDD